jgi:hypothetical protein
MRRALVTGLVLASLLAASAATASVPHRAHGGVPTVLLLPGGGERLVAVELPSTRDAWTLPLPCAARRIASSQASRLAVVQCASGGRLVVVDVFAHRVLARIRGIGPPPSGPARRRLALGGWSVVGDGEGFAARARRKTVTRRFPEGLRDLGVAVTP